MLCGGKDRGLLGILGTDLSQTSQELTLPLSVFEVRRSLKVEDLLKQEVDRFWDCVDKGEKFRADSQVKNKMKLLLSNYRKIL